MRQLSRVIRSKFLYIPLVIQHTPTHDYRDSSAHFVVVPLIRARLGL